MEHDVHGCQIKAYRILKELNKPLKDNLKLNLIPEQQWPDCDQQFWSIQNVEPTELAMNDENVDLINMKEPKSVLYKCKTRKTSGSDGLNLELIKYASSAFLYKFLDFLHICWRSGHLPYEWNKAVVLPIFKTGNKKDCTNYRGISLLNSGYKIYARIFTQRLNTIAEILLHEEQNSFEGIDPVWMVCSP
jgi:sorting nexin-29